MYNLLVGFPAGSAHASRVVEYTTEEVRRRIAPDGAIDLHTLQSLPTIVMPEILEGESDFARLGRLQDLRIQGSAYTFTFVPDPNVDPIPLHRLETDAERWGIQNFEFYRTHWAVKDVDAYASAWATASGHAMVGPKAFKLPTDKPQSSDLVAVMMPFDAGFSPVYAALQQASADAGMRCQRADDIWKNEHILDDVLELIWTARVVVSDLTGKNANVFYETGIAHTIGRDVVLITQSMDHIPFDLRSIRALDYLPNEEGRLKLRADLSARLATILSAP